MKKIPREKFSLERFVMTAVELLRAEMPLVRMIESNLHSYGYSKGTQEWRLAFDVELSYYRKFGWSLS